MRIFCEPGIDSIIITPPTYGMYEVSAHINNLGVKKVLLTGNFQLDTEEIFRSAEGPDKLLFLCSPNNPTSNSMKRTEMLKLISRFPGIVIVDEAYIDFSRDETLASAVQQYPNLVVLQTFSKSMGLAGIRLGIAIAQPEILLQITGILSRAAGYKGMIEGQMQDMISEGKTLDLESLKRMHNLKTGALISASVTIGALLGGATPDQIRHLDTYALHIGLAFQVIDDILNVEGNPDMMGKSIRTDQDRNKSTFPGIIGLDRSKGFAAELVNNALQALEIFGSKADALSALASYIIQRKR